MERLYKCQERLEQRVEERMWCHRRLRLLNEEEDPLLRVLLKDRLYKVIGCQPNRPPLAQLYQSCLEAKEPGEEITAADIDAFEEALDCDPWELTPEQKRRGLKLPSDCGEIIDWRISELTEAAWEEGRRLNDICGAARKVVGWNVLIDDYTRMIFISNLPRLDEEAKEKDKKDKELSLQTIEGQIEALGEASDYDGSVLTAEQWRFHFDGNFASNLQTFGLRSPQYYRDKSQCLSVADTAWPGAVALLKADRLRRGYIEPEELIERLHKLKPSDNFELRENGHRGYYLWTAPPELYEEGEDRRAPYPWHLVEERWGLYSRETIPYRPLWELHDRWERAICGVQSPVPDLHLLKDMGRSPGGTLFPWYLVEGLMALREDANHKGSNWYIEEYVIAVGKRKEAIYRWKEKHPDSVLSQYRASDCRTWPVDLVDELDEIDRESVRCGRRKYIAHLRETEKKMQTLVAFWRDCRAVTGQRVQPRSWWDDAPILRVKRLTRPQYLKERLDAIGEEFGYRSEEGEKLGMLETVFWMDSVINSEPAASDTTFPQSLLDELNTIWQHLWRDGKHSTDDIEDEMLAAIRRWRESQHQPQLKEGVPTSPHLGADTGQGELFEQAGSPGCSRKETLSRSSGPSSILMPEEMRQLQEKLSQRSCRRSRRKSTIGEGQVIWQDRLRSRCSVVGASRERPKAAERSTGKPNGIVKRYSKKEPKKQGPTVTKATKSAVRADMSSLQKAVPARHHLDGSFLHAVPSKVTKARGSHQTRQSPRGASADITNASNGNRRCSRRPKGTAVTAQRKQGQALLRHLTPPPSV
ncbi:MAG: hypothetical protein Q9217_006082 [Psora testacea]